MERIENFVERSGFDSLEEFADDYEVQLFEKRWLSSNASTL